MDETKEKAVETILLDVVSRYLAVKVKGRTGLEWAKVRDGGEQRERYDREREKSAKSAFLAVRSRTGRDFVDYFAETLCSVPQRLSNADFALLSKTLQEDPERVRTITLLALSARG